MPNHPYISVQIGTWVSQGLHTWAGQSDCFWRFERLAESDLWGPELGVLNFIERYRLPADRSCGALPHRRDNRPDLFYTHENGRGVQGGEGG